MSSFHAWHAPGFATAALRTLVDTARGPVLAPALSAEDVAAMASAVAVAGEPLRARTNEQVIAVIDRVARRFLDPHDLLRAEALAWLPEVTGYAPAMCERILDRMATDWTEDALRRLLRAELRDPRVLERFVRHAPNQQVRAVPPRLALHILSGNVPGVGVTSLVRSLLARAPALCKTAAGEPVLPVLFARAIADHDADLASALAVTHWPGGDRDLEAAALDAADLVVHYGGRDAVADLRSRLPDHVRLVEHGPRISFAAIARELAGRPSIARDAALAVALFDQQGCVSPHVIYVEENGRIAARTFAERLARQLADLAYDLPRGRLSTAEAAAVQALRTDVEFRAIAGEDARLWAGDGLAWTVTYEADSGFAASCLHRTVRVKSVRDLGDVAALVQPYRGLLQTVALEAPRRRRPALAAALVEAGATRITTLVDMPWPPPSWHHDGRGPLRELLHFADLEGSR